MFSPSFQSVLKQGLDGQKMTKRKKTYMDKTDRTWTGRTDGLKHSLI